jgi:hypothetical protein
MARLFYVHWNREEGMATVRALRESGHTVIFHWSTDEGAGADAWKRLKASPPDAIIISLDRLPSHGRRIAAVTLETRAMREVPVIFIGGEPEKVAKAREELPAAQFSTAALLPGTLDTMLRSKGDGT